MPQQTDAKKAPGGSGDAPSAAEAQVAAAYAGASVLVTGAGGSIGLALCRRLALLGLSRLILLDMGELALVTAEEEVRRVASAGLTVTAVLGSVADARLVDRLLATFRVTVVIHAAAYKHVPVVEANPAAGLANNSLATATLVRQVGAASVARFVLVSSDKAVRPKSVMGVSKRLAEMVVQDAARRAVGTAYSIVRFGNVAGSSGSVIPRIRAQIAAGGPVTLTDPRAERYFISPEAAVDLVLAAGHLGRNGDVFMLDMGAPVRILDLAQALIAEAGHKVGGAGGPGIEIVTTGLRAGEKLVEDLPPSPGSAVPSHPGLRRMSEDCPSQLAVAALLRDLRDLLARDDEALLRAFVDRVAADCDDRNALSAEVQA